jgi:uncharacterized protein (TIGR02266 family)
MVPDPRQNIRLAIFIGPDHQKLMTNYSVNMSTGGVFIESGMIHPIDTTLVLKFKLSDNDKVISCKARVAWTNEPGQLKNSSLPPGMGIQFLDLSLENLQAIRNFIKDCDLQPVW